MNMPSRRDCAALLLGALALAPVPGWAGPSDDGVTIGVLTDMSGPYAAISGLGSVTAARMAVEDFGGKVLGKPIRVLYADHQNKADVGASIARRWIDTDGVDAIFDVPNSAVAHAVISIVREKGKIAAFSGSSSSDITGKLCTDTTSQWAYDIFALVNGSMQALASQGIDRWYFLTLDAVAGHGVESLGTKLINASGGKVVGVSRHPINTPDFSSFLLQAQQSGAKALVLANAGQDTVNSVKQATEFGLQASGMKVIAPYMQINDVHAVGSQAAQGVTVGESFYWDLNDETRQWNKRFQAIVGAPANMIQAGVYSAVLHYLKAVQAAGTTDSLAVARKMKETPINDFYSKNVELRQDGRVMRDFYIFQVKKPAAQKGPWDHYDLIKTVPGKDLYRKLEDGGCPLVK